jgi:hypothetical protein
VGLLRTLLVASLNGVGWSLTRTKQMSAPGNFKPLGAADLWQRNGNHETDTEVHCGQIRRSLPEQAYYTETVDEMKLRTRSS